MGEVREIPQILKGILSSESQMWIIWIKQ